MKIADLQLGELLAYSPPDPDVERGLIGQFELRSDEIERGIVSEQLSKRGAYWEAMFEGGAQERGLAETAKGWATASHQRPRTAATLMAITQMWEDYAERADLDAQKSRERLG